MRSCLQYSAVIALTQSAMAVMKMKAMKALKVTDAKMLKMQATIKEQGKTIKEYGKHIKVLVETEKAAYEQIQKIMKKVNALTTWVQYRPSARLPQGSY